MKSVRLVLATEQPLFRAGLRALFERLGGMKVVGETGSGREAVVLARHHRPALVLIEPDLAELGGLEAAAQILHFSPGSRVVVLATHADRRLESRALQAGASAVIPRSATTPDLEGVIRKVLQSRDPDDPPGPAGPPPSRPRAERRTAATRTLTPRQLEVLKLLVEGSGVKKIARQLGISPKTVETHRSQIMERLQIYDLVGLVRFALREKITRL